MPAAPRAPAPPQPSQAARSAARGAADAAAAEAQARAAVATTPASAAERATASAAILAAIVTFLSAMRERDRRWLQRELPARADSQKTSAQDLAEVIAEEDRRGQAFAEGVIKRVTGDIQTALAIPDSSKRAGAIQGILQRERHYASQRSEAMAARAFAAIERIEVRHDSPLGAYWKLDPNVAEHTAGCVVAETLVAGPEARRGFSREYAGKLVELVVATGEVLRVTPHHPVLTPTGWRPAGELREGDQVLRDGGRIERHGGAMEDPRDVPSIEQVVQSIEQLPSAATTRRRMKRLDLHGDFTDGDVRVVAADRRLLHALGASGSDGVSEQLLVGRDPAVRPCPSCGRSLGAGLRERDASKRAAARTALLRVGGELGRRHARDGEPHGLSVAATDHDAAREQLRLQRLARDAKLCGERLHGLAGVVALGQIVKVRHFDWAGHVYNLSTDGGWYTANGLIVENCLVMGSKFWPWAVLNRVHPPRHAACPCRLKSWGSAVADGDMAPGDIPDMRAAVRAAAGVVMEAIDADAILAELDLRDQLVESGLVSAEALARIPLAEAFNPAEKRNPLGRWTSGAAGAAEELVAKAWRDPPAPVGKAGERKGAGGYSSDKAYATNTELGRAGEAAFVKIVGGRILHPEGKGEQSPLDVHFGGYAFEVKAVSRKSLAYKATPKPFEQDQKESAAKELGVKPALAMVVMDSEGKQAHAYYREGLKGGRLSQGTGWRYLGSTAI